MAVDADIEWLMLDLTVVGGRKKTNGIQSLGRSVGGFSCKIHAVCDSLGNPLKYILSEGKESDYKQALNFLQGLKGMAVLADRGYDADYIIVAIEEVGAQAVIPPKKNRNVFRNYDTYLCKERNLVERLFNKIKNFRRVTTRYGLQPLA